MATGVFWKRLFKGLCLVITLGTICYWLNEYAIKDDDLSWVHYEEVRSLDQNELPIVSICFNSPFSDQRIKEIDSSIDSSMYFSYLKGDVNDERFKRIDYNNVTLQVSDIFLFGNFSIADTQLGLNASGQNQVIRESLSETFSGFINGYKYLNKCFGFKLNDDLYKKIDDVVLKFSFENVLRYLHPFFNSTSIIIHYPNQLLLSRSFRTIIDLGPDPTWIEVKIRGIEILKQRFKPDKCMNDWSRFDELTMQQHIEEVGCRPPYLSSLNQSKICATREDMKNARFELRSAGERYLPPPCRQMTSANYEMYPIKSIDFLSVKISFPKQIKIIVQTKAINFQAFVGNVGGYIGLFLGKTFSLFII